MTIGRWFMLAASPAPTIAAMIVRARRKIVGHFFVHHAISAEDAVAYVPQRRIIQHQFDRMRRGGVIREASPGRYWIDLAAYQSELDQRRRVLVPIVILTCLVIAGAILFAYRT
ncbi:hypothetical protein [Sphingomonas sp. M1-B02]|uniref:hypothetical protein n=1 Tax=Sphingomonas sp. M1-B02 TaxID=3114300 RepID=UPI00223F37B6|nr:hypothetical protein [Sphingomonas sp. S6-11]UZK66084.1 hypothetical protein OKW87_16495 [Sphingomonas sp. S6-11]